LRQTSGALRPNRGDRRHFAGFLRFVVVKKYSGLKGLNAADVERRSVRGGFNCRMNQLCEVRQRALSMRCARASLNSNAAKHLRPGLCFPHGSNINSRDESCGKLKASGFCAKSLAAKTGQAERAKFLLRICQIQPGRVSAKLVGWLLAENGIRIHGILP
jgi:hypothetical protein